MEYTTLGRTGLQVSVVGLGGGGPSRLGQATGRTREESVAVVRRALDLGVTYLDTAEAYGTEEIMGQAIQGLDRDAVVISSKKGAFRNGEPVPPEMYAAGVEQSLRRLGVESIDVYHVHGPRPDQYEYVRQEIVPVMQRLQKQGKIKHLAISEHFSTDLDHSVLRQAIADDLFDVVMVGFNILNQSARETVFPLTQAKGIATECMFAVRRAFSDPARLREILSELIALGEIDAADVDLDDPLGWAVAASDAASIPELAYRFCRYEPGMDVVLTGTGNIQHLEENVRSLLRPPLPQAVTQRLQQIFGRVRSASGS